MLINCTFVEVNFERKIVCAVEDHALQSFSFLRPLILAILIILVIGIRIELIIIFKVIRLILEYLIQHIRHCYSTLQHGYNERHRPQDIELGPYQQI